MNMRAYVSFDNLAIDFVESHSLAISVFLQAARLSDLIFRENLETDTAGFLQVH